MNNNVFVKIVNVSDNPLPEYKTAGAAGLDLMAADRILVKPHSNVRIPTGLYVEIPNGYEGQIRSRSGLSESGLVVNNSPATIDSDYRGEIKVLMRNQTDVIRVIEKGDRIAQFVVAPVCHVFWEQVSSTDDFTSTERGEGGMGSTGV